MATAVVVGGGRVGQALLSTGPSTGGDLLLRRGEALPPAAPAGPILVCTRNDGVLDATPKSRWQERDAGLETWLESKGLAGANQNQVLAYLAVSKLGEPPVDGINPEGLTAALGNWAPACRTAAWPHLQGA